MKHKGLAFIVTAALLLTMIPVMAFATVDDLVLTDPDSPAYLRSNTDRKVPVEFELNADSDDEVSATVSLMQGDTEKSYTTSTLYLDDESWEGIIDLDVDAGTPEGIYDIKIALIQDSSAYADTFDGMVIIDNTAPTSTITEPSNMEELDTGESVDIIGKAIDPDITGTAIDGSGVAGVAIVITGPSDYSEEPDVSGKRNWSAEWTTPTTPGAYNIAVSATDKAGNAQLKATSITVYVGMDAPDTYTLSMAATTGGTSSAITEGPYTSGAAVSIAASANNRYEFTGWTAPAGTFANDEDPTTTFTMPNRNVTVTANFRLIGSEDNEEDGDTVAYKAAPAIAAEILKANGIAPNAKGGKGEKGMNYISEVARTLDKGASYEEVLQYLEGLTGEKLDD